MTVPFLDLLNEEAKLRAGLAHIRDLKHEHFKSLLGNGHVKGHVTEKSDGMAFEVGHDEHGIYTRTSRSDKMRQSGDYGKAARKKFGAGSDPSISKNFDDIHHHLTSNPAVVKHLRYNGGSIKGEIFHKPQGQKVDDHHTRFVGTAYDTRKMGKHGSFIVHSKLPENHKLGQNVGHLSDGNFKFDSDHTGHELHVDATDLHKRFHALNADVLHSRKKADAEGKIHEKAKFEAIKHDLHHRIADSLSRERVRPKWGPETEGHVIHPHESNPNAPRIKMVDGNFMARKNASQKFVKEEKELLVMGGNVHFGDSKTVPIKIEDRDHKAKHVDEFMRSANKATGHKLFGKHENSLNSGTAYSGSSRHMMDKSISSSDLGKHKKTFGDVDVMVPHSAKEHILKHMTPGTKHGHFTVQGIKDIGGQHSVVAKHSDGSHHQIDFEYKDHDKHGEPTKYSQWSQNSHYGDMKKGLKGVFHKHLVNSASAADSTPGILETKMKTKTKHEPIEARKYTFSPSHGMRDKHVPALDAKGNHIHMGGKPVYHQPDSKGANYDRDLNSIHHKLFGHKASPADIEHLHSFHGTAHLIKKHFNHEQRHKVLKTFVNKLYGHEGRTQESNDMKDHAIHQLKHHFPEHFDDDMHSHIKKQKDVYMHKNKLHEASGKKEDLHIAMAAGRFTGPTKEHQKLIDNVLSQKADRHHVFVMGPADHSKITEKDPLTVHEKISHLKKLYPDHKHIFVPGTTQHTKTPAGALSWMHFKHKDKAHNLHLHVVAGEGSEGVEKNAGGSIDNYKNMVGRLNGTKFPVRTNEHGKVVGGDHRMNYKTTTFIGQTRGNISGSKIRAYARDHDHDDHGHVEGFRKMMHSGMTHDHAAQVMKQIKHSGKINESLTPLAHFNKSKRASANRIKMTRGRKFKLKNAASMDQLKTRANREALRTFRNSMLGLHGTSYGQLTAGQKVYIDKVIGQKGDAVARLSRSLVNSGQMRMKDRHRIQRLYGVGKATGRKSAFLRAYNMASEAYDLVAEEAK